MNSDHEDMRKSYEDEARERWGGAEAYKEYEERAKKYTQSDWDELYDGMDAIFEGFGRLCARGVAPDHEKPRLQVRKLRQFISDRLYECTDEILQGLAQMYVADERFKSNIDRHGEGTAEYVARCIESFCERPCEGKDGANGR